jgi:hypothetical protein
MRAALALCVLSLATPASSHCFSVWRYPTPQHCGVGVKQPDHSWFVEVVPPAPPPAPVRDERSPQDIKDQADHDAALAIHHDELNFLMSILQMQEQSQ